MTSETNDKNWLVYIIEADDLKLYTGITNNLEKRWHAHNHLKSGAKFFRGRKPLAIRYQETGHNRSSASRREAEIKKLSRAQKLQLIDTYSPLTVSQS